MRKPFLLSLLLACTILSFGCAQNTINLRYRGADPNKLAASNAKTLCIVDFTDARPTASIGKAKDGSDLYSQDDVRLWFARAIAARMSDLGFLVTHAPNHEAAMLSKADYILTGEVQQVWLVEQSMTSYEAKLSMFVSIKGRSGATYTNTINSVASQTIIPLQQKPDLVLKESMNSLMETLALFVQQKTMQ